MKRIWIGIGFLVGLLVLGLAVMKNTDRQLETICQTLEQTAETQAWDEAVNLAQKAQKEWQKKRKLMAALADHSDIDTIDALFARLEVYQRRKDETEHAAICAQLSKALHTLEENHRLTWYNLL